ncbi:hypothetical protein ACTOJ1_000133 [Shigella flexneri]
MNNKKTKLSMIALLLFSFSINAETKDVKTTFNDDNGNQISCIIDTNGETHCKNGSGENVICANSDNGYLCSAN